MTTLPLKDALRQEALAMLAEGTAPEALNMRALARRLGVSHQAPYKHYPDRDHLLAAIVTGAFRDFARHLEDRPRHDDPFEDLEEMGRAYLGFARSEPLKYHLIFVAPHPPVEDADLQAAGRAAFGLLEARMASLPRGPAPGPVAPEVDALIVWSALHGFAALAYPAGKGISPAETQKAAPGIEDRLLARITSALKP